MNKNIIKEAFIKTLPIMAGYIVLGSGFGILLNVNGYGVWWAILMSVFIYAGSMQYIAIALITDGVSLLSVALTTLLVNGRHLFYGISMIDRYKGAGLKKLYLMHALTDETYSLVCSTDIPEDTDPHKYYLLISFFNQMYWIIGSILGSLMGSMLDFDFTGVEFSMTALFVTIFVEQWLSTDEHRPALIGLGISITCILIFGQEHFLIPAMIAITALLMLLRSKIEGGISHD